MSLQLPPPRSLPDPDRIIDAILDDELTARRHRSPRRIAGLVAAAVVLILVAVGFAVFNVRNQPQVADPPVSASTAVTAPTPALTPTPPTTQNTELAVGKTAIFEHFSATVVAFRSVDGIGYFVQANVCVRELPATSTGDTTSIGWDAWTVTTSAGVERPDGKIQQPVDLPRFPAAAFQHVGECVQGWIPFGSSARTSPVRTINYHNDLGERVQWVMTPIPTGPGPRTRIGDTLHFRYLTVTVGDPIRSGGLYASSVETCVTALPPGTPKTGVRLLRGSWSLTTSAGKVTIDDPITDAVPLPTTYPDSGLYRVGQCVHGYVPFGIEADADVKSVDYRNALGDRATWRADS